ncbi:MAG: LysR substrate-binding domain-containing protein [Lewinella sp.]|jgi:DNA-binding transcriptional LysR family regulator|nr:LysR substrate-binding domain-containing protein [Lewinella sp.]
MNFTLRQLAIFSKVVEYQSVTKASEALYLSQPAVSIQLRKLQEQFDIPLTEVVGRQLYVTDFGREIARSAEKILAEVEDINHHTSRFRGKLAGCLKLSIVSTAKYVMPYFLSGFMARHASVDLVMDVTNKTRVIESLENNEVDFSLVSVLPEQLDLKRVELMRNKLYLVGGTVLNRNPKTSARKLLTTRPLLFREQGSATRDAMERFLVKQELPAFKKIELTSNEALKQAIVAGLGYSIMPLIGIKNELRNGSLEIIKTKGLPIVTHWNLVWRKAKKLSPVAEAYLVFLNEEKERIIKDQFGWFEEY